MPVSTPNPEYLEALPTWTLVDTCISGQAAIKKAGVHYLPMLAGSSTEDYQSYLTRANFFNCTGRTHEAMLGFLFRKPPQDDLPTSLEDLGHDADLAGSALFSYARQVAAACCGIGRAGTLIDFSTDELRPYLSFYSAIAIINWRTERIHGKQQLTLVVLAEMVTKANPDDTFTPIPILRYRALKLEDGIAKCEIWEAKGEPLANATTSALPGTGNVARTRTGSEEKVEEFVFTRRGVPLTFLPFIFHGADTPGCGIGKSPLEDIANINISHFQTSADLENARHVCGSPTPYACGFGEDEKLYLGTRYAWTTENTEAKAGFIEFTGTGVGALEKAAEQKQAQMAAVGAGLIEPQKSQAEAFETVELRASAETSVLARIGMLVSETISQAVQIADWWTGTATELNRELRFTLNTDFTSAAIRPEMLTALIAAYLQGAISKRVLFRNLERGELYEEGWTFEDEQDAIEADPPPMPDPLPAPAGGKPPGGKPPAKKTAPKAK